MFVFMSVMSKWTSAPALTGVFLCSFIVQTAQLVSDEILGLLLAYGTIIAI
jgi:hypothetical protein